MAYFSSAVQTLIKAVGDAAGGLAKIVYGTPGSTVKYPTTPSPGSPQYIYSTGLALTSNMLIDAILDQLGVELDKAHRPWACISTNATKVAPSILAGYIVTGVAKDEVSNSITVTISPAMGSANYAVQGVLEGAVPGVCQVTVKAVGSATLRFWDLGGALLDINDRMVSVFIRGQA